MSQQGHRNAWHQSRSANTKVPAHPNVLWICKPPCTPHRILRTARGSRRGWTPALGDPRWGVRLEGLQMRCSRNAGSCKNTAFCNCSEAYESCKLQLFEVCNSSQGYKGTSFRTSTAPNAVNYRLSRCVLKQSSFRAAVLQGYAVGYAVSFRFSRRAPVPHA